jgi:hypothetical protein
VQHVLGAAAEQHRWMGLLQRLRERLHRREIVVLAVELGGGLRPQLLHGRDRLARLRPAVVEVAAHDLGLFAEPAGADAEQGIARR